MEWKFKREESNYESIPVGEYRLRIAKAEKTVSQSGKDMIKLEFDVSGTTRKLWHYIVFLPDYPEITNRNLTQLFDSFGIEDEKFNVESWIGKVGACKVKHDEEGRAKVHYFINKIKAETLPAWVEGNASDLQGTPTSIVEVSSDDLPF